VTDEHLRRLERDAERGDPEAAARLARERDRRGLSVRWEVAATWRLGDAERATDVLFTSGGGDLVLAFPEEVRVLDSATGERRAKTQPGLLRRVGPIAVDATRLYVGEVSRGRSIRERAREFVRSSEAAPPGPFTIGHQVLVHALPGLALEPPLAELPDDVTALAASGGVVLAACGDAVHAFGPAGVARRNPWLRGKPVQALALSRDGSAALVVNERQASVRPVFGGAVTVRLDPGEPLAATGALSDDGAYAVLATANGVQVWDAARGVRLHHLLCLEPPIRRVSLGGANGDVIVVAAADRVFTWHLATGVELGGSDSLGLPVTAAVLDPTGRLLVALNPIRVWVLRAG
jgi:hypothetical protein